MLKEDREMTKNLNEHFACLFIADRCLCLSWLFSGVDSYCGKQKQQNVKSIHFLT